MPIHIPLPPRHIFLTAGSTLQNRWHEAFPRAQLVAPSALSAIVGAAEAVLWLDGGRSRDSAALQLMLRKALEVAPRVVVMRPNPSEQEAFSLLGLGASGYCHVAATPGQLREIARVVSDGGIWMPPELLRRITSLSQRVLGPRPADTQALASLTEKEQEVARMVGQGASNREIAEQLSMSERTVKSHLSSIFRKLDVRDRVQLALAMHNLPINPQAH